MQQDRISTFNKSKILQLIYFVGVSLYFIYYWMHVSQLDQKYVPKYLLGIAIICFIVKIVFTRYELFEAVFGGGLLLLMFCCWKMSGSIDYPLNAILLLGLKNVDIKELFKLLFYVVIVSVSIIMTWTLLHNLPGIIRVQDYGRGGVETRFQFGWWHPNRGHSVFFTIIVLFLSSYFKKCKWWIFVCLIIFNYECFLLTKSKTGFIVTLISIVFFFLLKLINNGFHRKVLFFLAQMINILCIVFSMIGIGIVPIASGLLDKLNKITTGRVMIAKAFYAEFGIHTFGTSLGGKIPDLGIARTLLEYGIVVFILLYSSVLVATWILYKKNKLEIMLLLTIYMIYFTFEAYFQAAFDIKPIIIGYAFYQFSDVSFYRKTRRSVRKRGFD